MFGRTMAALRTFDDVLLNSLVASAHLAYSACVPLRVHMTAWIEDMVCFSSGLCDRVGVAELAWHCIQEGTLHKTEGVCIVSFHQREYVGPDWPYVCLGR